MSPARLHRERLAAAAAGRDPATPIASNAAGGQPATPSAPVMTPAREHRIAQTIAGNAGQADEGRASAEPRVDPAAAQVMLRLAHDLRRLKEIQSIERKIEVKREMLPEYRPWCEHLLEMGRMTVGDTLGSCGADDVLPTMMIWAIDTGDWSFALELAAHVLRFNLPLPARYQRQAAPLIVEEVADAALKLQAAGEAFPLDVLEEVEALTAGADMHDEIRAKLMKAIGSELMRQAEEQESGAPAFGDTAGRALAHLRRAQELHDRAGAKDKIKRLEKALAASAATEQAGAAG